MASSDSSSTVLVALVAAICAALDSTTNKPAILLGHCMAGRLITALEDAGMDAEAMDVEDNYDV